MYQEHLHVYHAPQQESRETFAQPFHTDNGLLLLITPFMEHPVKVRSCGALMFYPCLFYPSDNVWRSQRADAPRCAHFST